MTYFENHPMRGAFVSHWLNTLTDLIADQGEEMLRAAKITFPSRAVSIVLIVGERGEISAADIGQVLQQPHQLVTQRVDFLVTLGVLERAIDPEDKRRKILLLTPTGTQQFSRLVKLMEQVSAVFSALFAEIECDIAEMAKKATEALGQSSLLTRIDRLPADISEQSKAQTQGAEQ